MTYVRNGVVACTEMAETRRSIKNRRPEILADFDWLLEREDEEGFRLWLKCHGLVEGSEPYEQACVAWKESMLERRERERQSALRRPGAFFLIRMIIGRSPGEASAQDR